MKLRKELAKFLSGFACHEVLSHALLSGSGLLPLSIFGINVTAEYNAGIIIMWVVIAFALIYYAWFKKN